MSKVKLNNILKNENGSGLVLSLMVLLVLSVLGTALGVVTIGSYRFSDNNRDNNSAYYIAEAGANMAYEEIKKDVMSHYDTTNTQSTFFQKMTVSANSVENKDFDSGFESQLGKQPILEITVTEHQTIEDSKTYTIESTGKVAGEERTVSKDFTLTYRESVKGAGQIPLWDPGDAIIFKDEFWTLGFDRINGNVKTNDGILSPGWRWDPYWLFGWHYPAAGFVDREEKLNWEVYTNALIGRFPEIPSDIEQMRENYRGINLVIENDSYIPNLNRKFFSNITIRTKKNQELNIVVDNLDLWGISNFTVEGEGTVNLFVNDNLEMRGVNVLNKENRNSQLNLLYAGDEKITIAGGTNLNASLFVKDADIEFRGFSVVTDGIITGGNKVELSGYSRIDTVMFAPRANVEIRGGARINGVIIAERVDIIGSVLSTAAIEYSDEYTDDFNYYSEDGADVAPGVDDLISSETAIESNE